MVYTDEQKAEAVRLYLEVGPDEAAKATGCSRRQVYRWLGSHGVSPKKPDERRAETEARHYEKREQLRELLLDQAADALHRMKEPHIDYRGKDSNRVEWETAPAGAFRDYALAAAILIDKYRLEMGESTSRTELHTDSQIDRELARAVDEFRRQTDALPG
jgi:transposase-like protein